MWFSAHGPHAFQVVVKTLDDETAPVVAKTVVPLFANMVSVHFDWLYGLYRVCHVPAEYPRVALNVAVVYLASLGSEPL